MRMFLQAKALFFIIANVPTERCALFSANLLKTARLHKMESRLFGMSQTTHIYARLDGRRPRE